MIWRVSTDRGFQTVEAPSHKAAARLVKGKVLRVRSTKTPQQMAARKRVQEQRARVESLLNERRRLSAEIMAKIKVMTPSQINSNEGQQLIDGVQEHLATVNQKIHIAQGELFRRQEQKKALAGTQLV